MYEIYNLSHDTLIADGFVDGLFTLLINLYEFLWDKFGLMLVVENFSITSECLEYYLIIVRMSQQFATHIYDINSCMKDSFLIFEKIMVLIVHVVARLVSDTNNECWYENKI